MSATVSHKETFQQLVTSSVRLRLVDMPGWAGLGGVRYIPQGWESLLLTDQAKGELNKLNIQVVDRLRATDAAFSLGESIITLWFFKVILATPSNHVVSCELQEVHSLTFQPTHYVSRHFAFCLSNLVRYPPIRQSLLNPSGSNKIVLWALITNRCAVKDSSTPENHAIVVSSKDKTR